MKQIQRERESRRRLSAILDSMVQVTLLKLKIYFEVKFILKGFMHKIYL